MFLWVPLPHPLLIGQSPAPCLPHTLPLVLSILWLGSTCKWAPKPPSCSHPKASGGLKGVRLGALRKTMVAAPLPSAACL